MKLFPFLVVSAMSSGAGNSDSGAGKIERAFANVPEFIAGKDDWWNPTAAGKQFNDLQIGTQEYFGTFYPADNKAAQRAALRVGTLLDKTRQNLMSLNTKCQARGENGRRRRAVKVQDRWTVPKDSPRKALFQLFWAYARWARNQIFPNCPKAALRIYKRMDRLQLITAWHYCDKVDESEGFCDWALYENDGRRKTHPRKSPWLESQYGKDAETPFVANVCEWDWQGADRKELSCPFGGTIHITKARYGRWHGQICAGDKAKVSKTCGAFVDVSDYAMKMCEGKSACTLEASNSIMGSVVERQDPCHGTPKYTNVHWVCGDYGRPAGPDDDFEIACEWPSQEGAQVIEMTCPKNAQIQVSQAQYGRWSAATCPAAGQTSYGKTCDKFVDVLAHAASACDGKQSCSYRASNKVNGEVVDRQDPCHGVLKYTRVKYQCN